MGKEQFRSKFTFIMAMAGSAIGLGNIWRFPYVMGENGGAAFIIIYLCCCLLLSIPVFICESIIGRRGGGGTYVSMSKLAPNSAWKGLGSFTAITAFIIISYYSVVGGWSLDYFVRSCVTGLNASSQEVASSLFFQFSTSVWEPIISFVIFVLLTSGIVMLGVNKGIERFTRVATPLLGVLVIVIAIFSCTLPGASAGIDYLLHPDWSRITPKSISYALGQSFYSMSLGTGAILVYSAFMKKKENILAVSAWTAVFDTLFAVIAGFAIMPAVFSAGIEPGSGPSLVFETLPYIFSQMGAQSPILSRVVTILFFLAILLAALTSSISLLEVCIEHMMEKLGMSRKKVIISFFGLILVLGSLCSLSFGLLGDVKLFGHNIFSICDVCSSNYLMTLIALATSLFVGWKMDKNSAREEFTNGGSLKINCLVFDVFHFMTKWVVPILIFIVFLSNLIFF